LRFVLFLLPSKGLGNKQCWRFHFNDKKYIERKGEQNIKRTRQKTEYMHRGNLYDFR